MVVVWQRRNKFIKMAIYILGFWQFIIFLKITLSEQKFLHQKLKYSFVKTTYPQNIPKSNSKSKFNTRQKLISLPFIA